jgi:hypothetical protein
MTTRSVQVGDWAIVEISTGKSTLTIPIIGFTADGIIIGDAKSPSLLHVNMKGWQVFGLKREHKVLFQTPVSGITGVPDIIYEVMLQTTNMRDMLNLCESAKIYSDVCARDKLWEEKIDIDFPGTKQYKPVNLTYRQQYIDLDSIRDKNSFRNMVIRNTQYGNLWNADRAILKDRLDILTVFYRMDLLPIAPRKSTDYHATAVNNWIRVSVVGYNYAVRDGKLLGLQWLALQTPPMLPTSDSANNAVSKHQIQILDWMESLPNPVFPDDDGANIAAENADIIILERLKKRGIYPTVSGANDAAELGHVIVLQWLANQTPPILPDMRGVMNAVAYREIDALNLIFTRYPHLIPGDDEISDLIVNEDIIGLKILLDLNIIPSMSTISDVLFTENTKILDLLAAHTPPIIPDETVMIRALEEDSIPVMKWILQHTSLRPSADMLERVVQSYISEEMQNLLDSY